MGVLIRRPKGFFQEIFYEQETVRLFGAINRDIFATLLDIQAGKALVLVFEREPGDNGLLELPIDYIRKQYDD